MSQIPPNTNKEEWLKVLGKGMITLPKQWRTEMGIENGDVVKAKKEGNKVIAIRSLLRASLKARLLLLTASIAQRK